MDYGNSELVQLSDLRSLEPDFFAPPVFAYHCRLSPGLNADSSSSSSSSPWKEGAEAIAEDKTDDVDIFVNFVGGEEEEEKDNLSTTEDQDASSKTHRVEISVDGQDLAKMLVKPPLATASDISVTRGKEESPSPFMEQVAKSSSKPAFKLTPIPNEKVVVTLCHVENLRNVYFHLFGNDVKLMSLASILDQTYMGMPSPAIRA